MSVIKPDVVYTYPECGMGRVEVSYGGKTVHFPWFHETPDDERWHDWYMDPDDGVLVHVFTDLGTGERYTQGTRW